MTEPHPTYVKLKEFFEQNPLCREAVTPLNDHALVRIRFTDHEGDYRFTAVRGVPKLEPGASHKPDVTLIIPPGAVDEVIATREKTLGGYGIRIMELVAEDNLDLKVRGWTDAGLFTLWRHGYFGYLKMGGGKVWEFLSRKGYGSVSVLYRKMVSTRPRDS